MALLPCLWSWGKANPLGVTDTPGGREGSPLTRKVYKLSLLHSFSWEMHSGAAGTQ